MDRTVNNNTGMRSVKIETAPPEDWRKAVTSSPRKGYEQFWQRRAEDAERRAHEQEERALLAEYRAEQAEQREEAAAERVDGLEHALTSRATIDQAKGVIMAVFGLNADAAFEVLVRVSQHANVKLATVAEQFLSDAQQCDLGGLPRDRLTRVLATCANVGVVPLR